MDILFSSSANLPSKFGQFKIISFKEENKHEEHCIFYMGDLDQEENVLVRIHSECLTSDVFGSIKCDCGEQLEYGLNKIAEVGQGMIVYLRQEGRGIGLFNKINAYALQDEGQDTIQANHSLGFGTDLRKFEIVADVLNHMGVKSVRLMSNNPEKLKTLQDCGIDVTARVPVLIEPNKYNLDYLKVKKEQLNHALNV